MTRGDYFACYLAGHAIELALKAVLIVDGISEDRLKNKFRLIGPPLWYHLLC